MCARNADNTTSTSHSRRTRLFLSTITTIFSLHFTQPLFFFWIIKANKPYWVSVFLFKWWVFEANIVWLNVNTKSVLGICIVIRLGGKEQTTEIYCRNITLNCTSALNDRLTLFGQTEFIVCSTSTHKTKKIKKINWIAPMIY